MNVCDAIKSRRTIRKFKQTEMDNDVLLGIIDCARISPSACNLQSLKYAIVTDIEQRKKMHPHIKYAGYIQEWNPSFGESPAAFIVVLNDTSIRATNISECDCGIAMMSISLMTIELGMGSCILGAVNKKEIKKILKIDEKFDIMYLIGLGYSDQESVLFESNETVKYFLDKDNNFKVPKRKLDDIIIKV